MNGKLFGLQMCWIYASNRQFYLLDSDKYAVIFLINNLIVIMSEELDQETV